MCGIDGWRGVPLPPKKCYYVRGGLPRVVRTTGGAPPPPQHVVRTTGGYTPHAKKRCRHLVATARRQVVRMTWGYRGGIAAFAGGVVPPLQTIIKQFSIKAKRHSNTCHFDPTWSSHRRNFVFTSNPLRFHFDATSSSLRFRFGVTSVSLRIHFDATSMSLPSRFGSISTSCRRHFDFTSN